MDYNEIFQKVTKQAAFTKGKTSNKKEVFLKINLIGKVTGSFILKLYNGKAEVLKNSPNKPNASIKLSADTLLGILDKRINPVMAFTLGKLKVSGDLSSALELKNYF